MTCDILNCNFVQDFDCILIAVRANLNDGLSRLQDFCSYAKGYFPLLHCALASHLKVY